MKNKLISALVFFCALAGIAYAMNTTHYSYALPTVGASQGTWGSMLNTIFSSIDSNIWSASQGTTIGVNAPSASGSNITLTNPINNIQNISFSTTGKALILPAENVSASMVVGGTMIVNNVGSNAFEIFAQDGTTAIVTSLAAGGTAYLTLLTNNTANGTFEAFLPAAVNGGALSAPAFLTVGTSAPSGNSMYSAVTNTLTFSTNGIAAVAIGTTQGLAVGTTYSGIIPPVNGGIVQGFVGVGTAAPVFQLDVRGVAASTLASNGMPVINKINVQTFTSGGTYTPSTGMTYAVIECLGPGGGGGGVAGTSSDFIGAGGGGGGGYARKTVSATTVGAFQTVTIGTGGGGGSSGANNGSSGSSSTSVGSLCVAAAGAGGNGNGGSIVGGGVGGVGTTGDILVSGGDGGGGYLVQTINSFLQAGFGGTSYFCGSKAGALPNNGATAGGTATSYGGGGSGAGAQASGGSAAGGNGGNGLVIITEYVSD